MSQKLQSRVALDHFAEDILGVPWGSTSKAELEFKIFWLLVQQGRLKLEWSDLRLAQELSTTLAKIRALRFKAQQRKHRGQTDWSWNELLDLKNVTIYAVNRAGNELILHAKDPFLKDVLTEKLREEPRPVLVRSSMTPGHLKVEVIAFWSKILEGAGLNEEEASQLNDRIREAIPERGAPLEKIFETATKGAGAANIASFALDFFSRVTSGS